jgi:hypothetical protein
MQINHINDRRSILEVRVDWRTPKIALFGRTGGVVLQTDFTTSNYSMGKYYSDLEKSKFPFTIDSIEIQNDGEFPRLVIESIHNLGFKHLDNKWAIILQLEDLSGICVSCPVADLVGEHIEKLNIPEVEVFYEREPKKESQFLNIMTFAGENLKSGVLHELYTYNIKNKIL